MTWHPWRWYAEHSLWCCNVKKENSLHSNIYISSMFPIAAFYFGNVLRHLIAGFYGLCRCFNYVTSSIINCIDLSNLVVLSGSGNPKVFGVLISACVGHFNLYICGCAVVAIRKLLSPLFQFCLWDFSILSCSTGKCIWIAFMSSLAGEFWISYDGSHNWIYYVQSHALRNMHSQFV